MAKMMDKFTVIRSIVGANGGRRCAAVPDRRLEEQPARRRLAEHGLGAQQTLWQRQGRCAALRRPCAEFGHRPGRPGTRFLGPAHSPFLPNKDGNAKEDMRLNGLTIDRLGSRKICSTASTRCGVTWTTSA